MERRVEREEGSASMWIWMNSVEEEEEACIEAGGGGGEGRRRRMPHRAKAASGPCPVGGEGDNKAYSARVRRTSSPGVAVVGTPACWSPPR